jgi:hypothetical protein
MNPTESNNNIGNAKKMTDGVKKTYNSIKKNKVVKVIRVIAVVVTGLVAIGGLFRVLTWVTKGWNQLTATMR